MQPRVACVFHQYPSYYNPLYFPKYHASLFVTKKSVCLWLSRGFTGPFLACPLCPPLQVPFDDNMFYISRFFDVNFHAVRPQVPLAYVECSSFSFCHLHRRLILSISKFQSICANVGQWEMDAESVLVEVATWLMREDDVYLMSLSESLSITCFSTMKRCSRFPCFSSPLQV